MLVIIPKFIIPLKCIALAFSPKATNYEFFLPNLLADFIEAVLYFTEVALMALNRVEEL